MPCRVARRLLSFLVLLVLCPAGFGLPPVFGAPIAANDVLVYRDGDRLQGRLISDDGKVIVFRSNRFGELRMSHNVASVLVGGLPPAEQPSIANDTSEPAPGAPGDGKADSRREEAETAAERQIIGRLSAALRRHFGPWHGRIAFSSSVVNGSDSVQNQVLDGRMERKWVADELRFDARYQFSSTDETTNTDLTKGSAYWRHDLSHRWFTLVHPSLEWNRNYTYNDVESDYLLVQNEIGGGITLWDRTGKKLRLGLAHNFYDVWITTSGSHLSRNIESMFVEAEFALPWNVKLTERGIRYFSFTGGTSGWESQFELSKKFSDNLVLALRHEIRYNQPAIRVEDSSSWRLLLGLDF